MLLHLSGVIRTIDIPQVILWISVGSTQLIKFKNNSIIGVVAQEPPPWRFLGGTISRIDQQYGTVHKEEFLSRMDRQGRRLPLICVGGTLRNLCKVDMHRSTSYKKIHNYIMDTANAVEICDDYEFSDLKPAKHTGLSKKGGYIPSGIGILKCFIE